MKPFIVLLLLGCSMRSAAQPAGMVRIPGGAFTPFLQTGTRPSKITVADFYLDTHAVTNAEFLQFVRANPSWQRSRVARIFADSNYLGHWAGDLDIGDPRAAGSPVTNISWFAADAYCRWKGKRLPTMTEWEYAADAAPVHYKGRPNTGHDLSRLILEWYDHPAPSILPRVMSTYRNSFGLYDMHGLVWEWVEDFNSILPGNGGPGPFVCGAGSIGTANKEDYAAYMRFAFRQSLRAEYTVRTLGFRCARDIGIGDIVQK